LSPECSHSHRMCHGGVDAGQHGVPLLPWGQFGAEDVKSLSLVFLQGCRGRHDSESNGLSQIFDIVAFLNDFHWQFSNEELGGDCCLHPHLECESLSRIEGHSDPGAKLSYLVELYLEAMGCGVEWSQVISEGKDLVLFPVTMHLPNDYVNYDVEKESTQGISLLDSTFHLDRVCISLTRPDLSGG